MTTPARPLSMLAGFAADVCAVTVFVAVGLRNHDGGSSAGDIVVTAVPFLIGLSISWTVLRAWRKSLTVGTGVVLWPPTVLIGMLLRNLVFGDGTATSFVIVATVFLGATMTGWRAVTSTISTIITRRTVRSRPAAP